MLVVIAGWIHRELQKTIQFYQAQLQALMDAQSQKRLRLTDEHRRLLAVKGKSSSRSSSRARKSAKMPAASSAKNDSAGYCDTTTARLPSRGDISA